VDRITKQHIELSGVDVDLLSFKARSLRPCGSQTERPVGKQDRFDMLWIRYEFIYSENPLPNFRIFFGHTSFQDVLVLKDKVGLDTGCVYGNKLSAIAVETMKIYQVSCGGRDK
jgi:hypothetical protein